MQTQSKLRCFCIFICFFSVFFHKKLIFDGWSCMAATAQSNNRRSYQFVNVCDVCHATDYAFACEPLPTAAWVLQSRFVTPCVLGATPAVPMLIATTWYTILVAREVKNGVPEGECGRPPIETSASPEGARPPSQRPIDRTVRPGAAAPRRFAIVTGSP